VGKDVPFVEKKISPDLVFEIATRPRRRVRFGDLRNIGIPTQLQQQFQQSVALIEFHGHEFEIIAWASAPARQLACALDVAARRAKTSTTINEPGAEVSASGNKSAAQV